MYWDANKALLQVMVVGSIYTPSWYISLATSTTGIDPWSDPRTSWELSGSATPLTSGWEIDPTYANDMYQAQLQSTATVDVPCPAGGTARYYVIRDGLNNSKWMFMGQLYNYPLTLSPGDKVRFPAGSLKIGMYN
jgi:hypothetical protein